MSNSPIKATIRERIAKAWGKAKNLHPVGTLDEVVDLAVCQLDLWREDPHIKHVFTMVNAPACGVFYRNRGTLIDCPCINTAEDVLGNWHAIDMEGKARGFFSNEVI